MSMRLKLQTTSLEVVLNTVGNAQNYNEEKNEEIESILLSIQDDTSNLVQPPKASEELEEEIHNEHMENLIKAFSGKGKIGE